MRRPALASTILGMAGRLAAGFLAGWVFWMAFSPAYERTLASVAETLLHAMEWPSMTELEARGGEILVRRLDSPPAAPLPGLAASDLHFNFVLLVALFALARKPWRGEWVARFLLAATLLWIVHLVALVFEVRSLYATRLGPWSAAHYGALARNFWAGGFHFYQIAGRFAVPFAIWWPLAQSDRSTGSDAPRRSGGRRRRRDEKRA